VSVYPVELILYGSADMPETDGTTVGGAVDLTRRISFSDMAANGFLDFVSSSSSDTAVRVQVSGLDGSGIQQTPAYVTLTGTTKVNGSQTFSRLLYGAASGATANGPLANPGGTAAVGDVAAMSHTLIITAHTAQTGSANATGITPPVFKLQSGDGATLAGEPGSGLGFILHTTGGTGPNQLRMVCSVSGTGAGQYGTDVIAVNRNWGTIPDSTTTYEVATGFLFEILPNPVSSVIRPFSGVSADIVGGSNHIYYEKAFVLNTDGTTATTNMTLIKQTDPNSLYSTSTVELDLNACSALNDTVTATNRQAVPASGIGSWSAGAAPQSVTLAPQSAASNTAAQAQGFWMRMTIAAGEAPLNTNFDLRPSGSTT
jgi:hypothetical protein